MVSESTLELVDSEIRSIIDECYDAAVKQLHEHRDQLEALTGALLNKETLEEIEAYEVAGITRGAAEAE
jgi:cell division protease FtsH